MKNKPLLTTSEEKILLLIRGGLTINTISIVLGRSPNTIKYHLKKIYKKLDAGNRIQAINKYYYLEGTKK